METIDALKQLGFGQIEEGRLGYDFGNFTLSAFHTMNRNFVEVIMVSGVFNSQRMISEVEIQIPVLVDSINQCSAFIAWGIDRQISKNFTPLISAQWLVEGRNNFDLLPWVKKQKFYDNRPKCIVDRDWLKLALRDLSLFLPQIDENEVLFITFQNGIFSIRSSLKIIAFPANGENWQEQYKISVGKFAHFPKRINYKEIEISIWEDMLCLALWRYPLIVKKSNIVE